jgi:hypothetical protein
VKQFRLLTTAAVLAVVSACRDNSVAPPKPAAIQVIAGDQQTGIVGQRIPTSPTFVVNDESGKPLANVTVAISVLAGNGVLDSIPSKSGATALSIGRWSLGPKVGVNTIQISVDGLAPVTVSATANAGAPSKLVPASALSISGRVAELVMPSPSARLTDAFDNPLAGATVNVSYTGGATGPATVTTDAQGNVSVPNWILGTVAGQNVLTLSAGAATASFIATVIPGDPTQLIVASGDQQRGLAGAALAVPPVVRLADRYGNGVSGRQASLTVTRGGGAVGTSTATTADDGTITVSSWTLGKSAVPQGLQITVGSFTADLSATVQTDYNIDVRFFGTPMTTDQKALFTTAAARIMGVVTGDVADLTASNLSVSNACGLGGLPTLNEQIDDLIIYASVQTIDGVGGILAQAGPCVFRSSISGYLTAVGVMMFDASDLGSMTANGTLQDVITHEMLHVLGMGTLWTARSLLLGAGTPSVGYIGTVGKQGCLDAGGSSLCSVSVPVENNGIRGTTDSHWRESTFRNELMTGYVNTGGMPFSAITVGGLGDLGYIVNQAAGDLFKVPTVGASGAIATGAEAWEKSVMGTILLEPGGRATTLKRP